MARHFYNNNSDRGNVGKRGEIGAHKESYTRSGRFAQPRYFIGLVAQGDRKRRKKAALQPPR